MQFAPPVHRRVVFVLVCIVLCLTGCRGKSQDRCQGYVEGEFVLVAAPAAGRLEKRWVQRGESVSPGAPLFTLEQENEQAARRESDARMRTAESRHADLTMALRSAEIDAAQAGLAQAQSGLNLSTVQLDRLEMLFAGGFISRAQLDEAAAVHARDLEAVAAAQAKLHSARSSIGREKEISAAKAEVEAARAALAQSDWRLSQRAVRSSIQASVQDTFYSEGEWVPAGSPVVSLLPPANVKLRFFVREGLVGALSVGRPVTAFCDGCSSAIQARISFISHQPEFTPPVIYSSEQRTKLVFLVEAVPEPAGAGLLHPGQPVDVELK